MIAAWMVYALLVGMLTAGAALGVESVLRLIGRPVRLVWAASLVLTVALVGMAPRRVAPALPEVTRVEMSSFAAPAQTAAPAPVADQDRLAALAVLRDDAGRFLRDLLATAGSRAPARLGSWLMGAWAAASLLALIALVATHARYRRLRRGWPLADLDGLRVRVAPRTGPAVVGLHRPEIVLPRWLLDLPEEERRLVLAHEQEHVRARDPLLLAAGCAAAALLPWHPASWWMLSRLRLAVEYDCDARVLRRGLDRRSYGTLLIDLAGRSSGHTFGLPALADEPTHLERRLRAMTSRRTRFAVARALAVGSLSGLALLVACEAKLPTAEDVARMDVSAVEALIAGSEALGGPTTGRITYLVDGKEVTEEQARAVAPEMIAGISMRTLGPGQGRRISLTTPDGSVRLEGDELVVGLSSAERLEAMKSGAAEALREVIGDAVVLIDGKRADLSAYRALSQAEIRGVQVYKDPQQATARFGPAAASGLILVTTKGAPRADIGGNGRTLLGGNTLTRDEMGEILARQATPPTVYLIDGAVGSRTKLFSIPEGQVWSLMVAHNPAFVELYGPDAEKGVVQVMTKTGSARQYERFVNR